jgi:hypothetical protein
MIRRVLEELGRLLEHVLARLRRAVLQLSRNVVLGGFIAKLLRAWLSTRSSARTGRIGVGDARLVELTGARDLRRLTVRRAPLEPRLLAGVVGWMRRGGWLPSVVPLRLDVARLLVWRQPSDIRLVRTTPDGTQRLTLEALDLGRIGAPPPLQIEVLADRVVE